MARSWRLSAILLYCLLVVAAAYQPEEWFSTLDKNQDGFLDKSEYDEGLVKLSAFLRQPLDGTVENSYSWTFPEIPLRGFLKAFTSAVAMIIATEIGDKTFFIAAVLSMKHDRSAVFAGAMTALAAMTILSTAMGLVLPKFFPKQYTHLLGGVLFLYFGVKLLYDSRGMEAGKASEELGEVEEELNHNGKKADEEQGGKTLRGIQVQRQNWMTVLMQALTLTFVAEWGDRSQIATIALAASKNPIGVTIGGCLGHSLCTGLAVLGGRMLASRISEKSVSQGGGIIFLLFGLHSILFED